MLGGYRRRGVVGFLGPSRSICMWGSPRNCTYAFGPLRAGFVCEILRLIFFIEEPCIEGLLNCLPVHGGFLSVEKSSFCSPSGDDAAAVYALKNVFPGR